MSADGPAVGRAVQPPMGASAPLGPDRHATREAKTTLEVKIGQVHAQAIAGHLEAARKVAKAGDLEAALHDYAEVFALSPDHVGALGDVVGILARLGRLEDAVTASRRAVDLAPANANLHAQLGNLLVQQRNWEPAEAALNKALVIDPAQGGALGGLASVYSHYGRSDEALALLRKATTHQPRNAGMHVRYGHTLEDDHRLDAARAAFQTALEIDPSNTQAKAGLRRVRDPDMMFGLIRAALADPSDAVAAQGLAAEFGIANDVLEKLLRFARDPKQADAGALGCTPLDRAALLCLCESRRRQDVRRRTGEAAPLQRLQVALPELDSLAQRASHEIWTPSQWLAAFEVRQTPMTSRVAAVVTMRDEGLYVLEWVAHYRALGVDTIFVYSNDNTDGSDSLLRGLAALGIITYVENRMDRESTFHPQRKAYAHALNLLPELWEHEWVFFFDTDELLVPKMPGAMSVGAILDAVAHRHPDRAPSAVCFNWNWRLTGSTYSYKPDLLLERFPHGEGKRGMKSLVRLRDVYSMQSVHFPDYHRDGFLVRSDLNRMEKSLRWKKLDYVCGCGQLNHYWGKSFEEFSVKKVRGDAASLRDKLWQRGFELFFTTDTELSADNFDPAPEDLCRMVEAEFRDLLALPGIGELHAMILTNLPLHLRRFDEAGGLETIYRTTQGETAGRYAPGFAPAPQRAAS